jgi:hypothetical protein
LPIPFTGSDDLQEFNIDLKRGDRRDSPFPKFVVQNWSLCPLPG